MDQLANEMKNLNLNLRTTINESIGCALAVQARRDPNVAGPQVQSERQLYIPHASLIRSLRKFTGNPTAIFKTPEQAEAVEFIIAGERHLLLVVPTGGGKTFAYLLPAAMRDHGITCVLLPLSALHMDFERRCKDLKIESSRWTPENNDPRTKIVYVSPEHAQTKQFGDYLGVLHSHNLIVQFAVDEVHLLPMHSSFRYCLSALKPLINSGKFKSQPGWKNLILFQVSHSC